MNPTKATVVIGLLGPVLDGGIGPLRWEKWRPTVAVCQHDDLLIRRLELLHQPKFSTLAESVRSDIAAIAPETEVRLHAIDFDDAWDFEQVYATLHQFA